MSGIYECINCSLLVLIEQAGSLLYSEDIFIMNPNGCTSQFADGCLSTLPKRCIPPRWSVIELHGDFLLCFIELHGWHFSLNPTSNLRLLLNICRDFQCFDLHILFCGRLCLCFFSGSSMLAFPYGKNKYPIFWFLPFTWPNSVHNFLSVVPGGLILSLTCHPHMQPYGMFLNSVHHQNSNRICKIKI